MELLPLVTLFLYGILALSMSSAATIGGDRKDLIEGDIYIGDKNTRSILRGLTHHRVARNAIVAKYKLWPNARVPYMFAKGLSERAKQAVKLAIRDLEHHTCLEFVQRTKETDYVYIFSDKNLCYSAIGRSGGQQKLSVGSGCGYKGIVIHELMHAVGFFHEQSRRDRDAYVTIHWQNIDSKQYRNFRKYQHGVADAKGEKYDYYSIMHYNKFSFSKNRRATITPKKAGVYIGQRVRLSATDTRKIKALYKCGVTTTAPPTTTEQPATTTKATTVGIVPTTKQQCVDAHYYCSFFAKAGFCKRGGLYKRFMYSYCKQTCGYCKPGSVDA